MDGGAQKRAIDAYRSRLAERGIVRFEIQALETDRALIRELARKMTANGTEAADIRGTMQQAINGEPRKKGGVLAALLRAPLGIEDVDFARPREEPRKIDL